MCPATSRASALPTVGQTLTQSPLPVDKAVVLGDGAVKAVYVEEGDIGTYTVLAADDPRAENKTLYIRPPANTLSHDELLALWEKKTGKTIERVYLPEDAVLKQIQGRLVGWRLGAIVACIYGLVLDRSVDMN